MPRFARPIIVLLLAVVVGMGVLIIARSRRGDGQEGTAAVTVVYAPCGMTGPLNAAIARFRQAHPEVRLEVVFDNANVLVRNIRRGYRPDVFISPGELEIRQLADEGFVNASTIRDFGSLDIVVYAPVKTKDLNSLRDLLKPHIRSISLADPRYNSIGFYAQHSLRKLGLWEQLEPKLRLREYPLEAVKLVTEGAVDAGITFLTCPLETAPDKASKGDLRVVEKLPRDSHPPVRLQLGLLKESAQPEAARRFVDFMASREAQEALAANGVLPAEEAQ